MSGRSFLDTNIVVYAADASPVERAKHLTAVGLLTREPDRLVLSTQVLQEFYTVVTRRIARPLDQVRAAAAVRSLCKLEIVGADAALVLAAIEVSREAQLSLSDAMIIEAARQAGCERVLTEDLSHGQVIRGVRVENPFLPPDR
jgi:predicted nucleic acid-binding protein